MTMALLPAGGGDYNSSICSWTTTTTTTKREACVGLRAADIHARRIHTRIKAAAAAAISIQATHFILHLIMKSCCLAVAIRGNKRTKKKKRIAAPAHPFDVLYDDDDDDGQCFM